MVRKACPTCVTRKALEQGWTRDEMLLQSRTIPGVYVPSLFKQEYDAEGAPVFPLKPLREDYQRPTRRIVADLNNAAYPTRQRFPWVLCTTGFRLKLPVAARAVAVFAMRAWCTARCASAPLIISTSCSPNALTKPALMKFRFSR